MFEAERIIYIVKGFKGAGCNLQRIIYIIK
jgi:hypothetical protein